MATFLLCYLLVFSRLVLEFILSNFLVNVMNPKQVWSLVCFMFSILQTLTEGFAMIGRMGRVTCIKTFITFLFLCYGNAVKLLDSYMHFIQGSSYRPSKLPPKPLEIWAYEVSSFRLSLCFLILFSVSFLSLFFSIPFPVLNSKHRKDELVASSLNKTSWQKVTFICGSTCSYFTFIFFFLFHPFLFPLEIDCATMGLTTVDRWQGFNLHKKHISLMQNLSCLGPVSVNVFISLYKMKTFDLKIPFAIFPHSLQGSPFCKLVREELVELELPHLVLK